MSNEPTALARYLSVNGSSLKLGRRQFAVRAITTRAGTPVAILQSPRATTFTAVRHADASASEAPTQAGELWSINNAVGSTVARFAIRGATCAAI